VRLLGVDDSALQRSMLHSVLTENGFPVDIVSSGAEALAMAKSVPYDAILTDYQMDEMDGITLVGHLRKLSLHRYTPILVVTTENDEHLKVLARTAGATGWVHKPYLPEVLLKALRKVLVDL
jgi:two-component system, chemotaxis family, chemotaxis protein CheY